MPVPRGAPWYLLSKCFLAVLIGIGLMIITWRRTHDDTQSFGLAWMWAAVVWVGYRRSRRLHKKKYAVLPVHVRYPDSFAL